PADESSDTLQWLDSLAGEDSPEQVSSPEADGQTVSEIDQIETAGQPADDEVSPNDDTLNTQIPSWLSQINDIGGEELPAGEQVQKTDLPAEEEPSDSASWLEQIGEDVSPEADNSAESSEREVLDWLDAMETAEAAPDQAEALDDLRESLEVEEPSQDLEQLGLETAKYFSEDYKEPESAEGTPEAALERSERADDESLPDWLSELGSAEDEEPLSLEEAIRKSGQPLSEEEQEFLSKSEKIEADNSEWLSKLDQEHNEEITLEETDFELEIEVEPDTRPESEPELATDEESQIPGGMLERLNENDQEDQDLEAAEIPEWLEDLKTEEEPQETAVLWLQEFIEKGERANVHDEIKRYTDELDPGDSIPKWMEDLKNEEDPQTTAMLWLEKFSDNRETPPVSSQSAEQEDTSDWLAELEREEADEVEEVPQPEPSTFENPDEGWLADLDIDEKLKSTTLDRDEFLSEKGEHQQKPENEEEPSWMKATSPLEGDIYTDELAGEQKEVEIPAWLAGYGEGEGPEETESTEKPTSEEPVIDQGSQESPSEEDEYTWVAAEGSLKATRKPIDLNKAAISQLESILGISYQVAKGIVHFREKQGPYHQFSDLMNVPEIVDEQTIEILKPEVFIGMVEEPAPEVIQKPTEEPKAEQIPEPKPSPPKKQKSGQAYDDILETARARLEDADLQAAADNYAKLIKKKKFLDEIITDLQQATLDHPLEITLQKILGDAYMKSDMLDEALEAYSKAEDLLS
ncbi:MAG: helix-hairpin-helix domain-containing protein, partial [Anaerolineales bacterium]